MNSAGEWEGLGPTAGEPVFGRVRLRTLILLRWLAVTGQGAAVLVVHFGLGYPLPLVPVLLLIAASAALNAGLSFALPTQRFARDAEAFAQLGYDVLQLCVLIALTGGLGNPFVIMLVAPVTIGVATLPPRWSWPLAGVALAGVALAGLFHLPLPWGPDDPPDLPPVYLAGMGIAAVIAVAFTAIYAWRVGREAKRMGAALAATQGVLAREQRLSALGGLAAAAAHELGTPLATIQLTAKEMARELKDDLLKDDALLLVSQAERCRDILKRLSEQGEAGDAVHDRLSLHAALDEAAAPLRGLGPEIEVALTPPPGEAGDGPVLARQAELLYALGNFIENAVEFAATKVRVDGRWDAEWVEVAVLDDGPGFPADVLAKIGEPYVSARRGRERKGGLGLGVFIAVTLTERLGGQARFANGGALGGAGVHVRWPRKRVEARKNNG